MEARSNTGERSALPDLIADAAERQSGAGQKPLRVLLVEDSEDDAELVLIELRRLGYAPESERVESPGDLEEALRKPWDLVICDYNLPRLNAPAALAAVKRLQAELPFLVVSGTTSEAQAVKTLSAGAQDFFQKGSLSRLGPAIERELAESEGKKARRKAESALRRSELRFKEVLENVTDLILLLSPSGETLYSSPSIERILGYSPQEVEGRNLSDFIPSGGGSLEALLRQSHADVEAGQLRKLILLNRSGRPVHLEISTRDATGKGLGFILNARDITERHRAEQALALAEDRLRMTVEAGRLGTWYMDIVTGAIEVNERGRQQVGWGEDEPLHFETFSAHLHPEDRERVQSEVGRAITGEAEFNSVFRVSQGDDQGPRWLHAIGRAFPDESGKPKGFFGAALDVTESKRAELLLVETQQRLRAALLGSNAGTFKLDFPSRILECDASLAQLLRIDGAWKGELAVTLLSRLHPDDRDRLSRAFQESASKGGELDEEFRLEGEGASPRWLAVKGQSFLDGKGIPAYMMGACVDISDRRLALDQLRQSQKMEAVGRLAGGIAHDFNNLLTAINGYAHYCLEEVASGSPLQGPLQEIRKAGERAASLTQQLLAYSRKQILVPKSVCLDDVVSDIVNLLSRLIGEDIRILLNLESSQASVRIDQAQMQQAIVNLALNSRDAMPSGGQLRLETACTLLEATKRTLHGDVPPGRYVTLRIEDTGTGMPPDVLQRIFEPFFTTKPIGKGTGLGLSMVYGMVRQSGGHVTVESAPDAGTIFTIYLPALGAPEANPEKSAPVHRRSAGGETILLVEDEESVLKFLSSALKAGGYRVHGCRDAAEALAYEAAGNPIDILVTDIVMNGMTGPDLRNRLMRSRHGLRVLFISGYSQEEALHSGPAGSTDFLQKPFPAAALLAKVRKLMDQPVPPGPRPS